MTKPDAVSAVPAAMVAHLTCDEIDDLQQQYDCYWPDDSPPGRIHDFAWGVEDLVKQKLAGAIAAERAAVPASPSIREALQELVALKDLKERIEQCWPNDSEGPVLQREYSTRKDAAWANARAALA